MVEYDYSYFDSRLRYCPETGNLYWRVGGKGGVKTGDMAGCKDGRYVRVGIDRKVFLAHRVAYCIMKRCRYSEVPMIDHVNGDGYDNRSVNLRPCVRQQNQANSSLYSSNTSGYKGVSYFKRESKWHAKIVKDGKGIHLGYYSTPEAAARAYDQAALDLFGSFARTNFIEVGVVC